MQNKGVPLLGFLDRSVSQRFKGPDIKKRLDTRDYPANHPSGIKTGPNSKVHDIFKYEAGGKQIVELLV